MAKDVATSLAIDAANAAHDLLHRDLDEAERQARALASSKVPEAAVVARWTLGKVLYERGRVAESRRTLQTTVAHARRHGLSSLEGAVLVSLAAVLVESGRTHEATEALDRADPLVAGATIGRLAQQRAFVWYHLGEWTAAIDACHVALPVIQAAEDRVGEARLVLLRGVSYLGQGDFSAATVDFRDARTLALSIGERLIAALAEHDLGCALGRQGFIPDALAAFERARLEYGDHGDSTRLLAILDADLAEILLLGGLTGDAVEAAERSAHSAEAAGNVVHEAEGRLMTARALLADGQPAVAAVAARASTRLFRRSHRVGWAAFAEYIALQADMATAGTAKRPSAALVRRAATLAETLRLHGWTLEAMLVETDAAQLALDRGDLETARHHADAANKSEERSGLNGRITASRANAVRELADGNPTRALAVLRRGLVLIDQHRALLGATELRVGAGIHAEGLARLGFRTALASDRSAAVFEWSERWRAGSLRLAPSHPPDDRSLAEAFGAWRHLCNQRSEASKDLRPSIEREIRDVERLIATLTRQQNGLNDRHMQVPSLADLRDAIGDHIMLMYTEIDGQLVVQRIDRDRARVFRLGPVDRVLDELAHVTSVLRRSALFGASGPTISPQDDRLRLAVDGLERALLEPVGTLDRPVVVVPSTNLLAAPFAVLRSLATVPFSVSPSAALWLARSVESGSSTLRVAIVAGPDLPASAAEAVELGRVHPGALRLDGARATVARVSDAFTKSDLIHVGAHGTFRRDNPLFSAFRCADGPLSVYDIERLGRVPGRIVLSSCSMAGAGVRPGGEVVGTAIALLHLGAQSVIAPIEAVDDVTTARFVVKLHEALAAGCEPAAALASARVAFAAGDPMERAVAALFTCLGT